VLLVTHQRSFQGRFVKTNRHIPSIIGHAGKDCAIGFGEDRYHYAPSYTHLRSVTFQVATSASLPTFFEAVRLPARAAEGAQWKRP
jgi:hypothetical protein